MTPDHVDVLIVGAGISGVSAAHHLQERNPGKSYAILEAREDLGGTWDYFRYPGIRSDTDMHTLGFRFSPWVEESSIADGDSILRYVRKTAEDAGIVEKIRYGHKVVAVSWSSEAARWTVEAERTDGGGPVLLTCNFLEMCSGYYSYEGGYKPEFPGIDHFKGEVIHPQEWPEDVDYEGERVVVIGSGATAVTLVPSLAEKAAKVTMLQRSPSYVMAIPTQEPVISVLRRYLPAKAYHAIARWVYIAVQVLLFHVSQRRPEAVKRFLRAGVERELPPGYDIDTHFKPRYNPWDQRICFAREGDFFQAISSGRAEVVTDRIETFTEGGIKLESGRELEADIVVTATGFNLLLFGGIRFQIDGEEVNPAKEMAYKGVMLSGIPNFVFTLGFANHSWTLKADLTSEYAARLIDYMDSHGHEIAVPTVDRSSVREEQLFPLMSGFVLRSIDQIPKQGSSEPWMLRPLYPVALRKLRHGSLEEGMRFSRAGSGPVDSPPEPAAQTA
jgi:monooxygenase